MSENKRPNGRVLSIRLLPEEARILKAKAKEANMSQAWFLKNAIVYGGAYEKTNFTNEDKLKLIYELCHIGNNLSQIKYRNNGSMIDEIEFLRVYDHYIDLLSAFDRFVRENGG